MAPPKKNTPIVESAEAVALALEGFDYRIDPEDFVIYALAGLIEEDRASFDDEEFRRLIDEGVHAHIQESPAIRAELAGLLRRKTEGFDTRAGTVAMRVVHALEDMDSDLSNVGALVRSYTSYLFTLLQTIDTDASAEEQARQSLARWRAGEISREACSNELARIGNAAAGPVADLLFENHEDREAAETAVAVLSGIRSQVSARILAHCISEPLLDEDIEADAFRALRALWPMPRLYILYNLRIHNHEDIPVLWFELFTEVDEVSTVEMAIEELRAHGGQPDYREDLIALTAVLQRSQDPELEEKILGAMNWPEIDPETHPLLQNLLQDYSRPELARSSPWARQALEIALNRSYRLAAKMYDAGRMEEAKAKLDEILKADSGHPFALMLSSLIVSSEEADGRTGSKPQ